MVMKVNSINSVLFRAKLETPNEAPKEKNQPQIKELSYVTPDFKVKTPQAYKKLRTDVLPNGLEVHSYKLANGHRVTIVPMEGSPAVVKNYVNVGSLNETPDIKGISHFLEHMAFNGTNGDNGHLKLDVGDSFKKLEDMGGWANASTNYAVTDYVNATPQLGDNDLEKQIKIIAAMTEDLKFSDAMIEKEKGPVCSEINMILDDPQTIALDQTVRTLFSIKNPADELVGGSVKHIKNLTRKDVLDYYNKYYTPDNMNLVITGDINPDEAIQIAAKNFTSRKTSQGQKFEERLVPIDKTVRKDFVSDKAVSTSVILGFAGPKNSDVKEKFIYGIAKAYLKSSSSNLETSLKKYNAMPYIDSEKISTNPNANKFIYLAASTSEENSEKVLKGIFDAISTIKPPTEEQVNEIKQKLSRAMEESLEYSDVVNTLVGTNVLNNQLDSFVDAEKILNEITAEDVADALKKYFDLNKAAITVVHPPKNNVNLSFQGKSRQPINMDKVEEITLGNNYDVGFYQTRSNNINYNIALATNVPYNKKAGVLELLDMIYSMGTESMSEDELDRFKEKNNITLGVGVGSNGLSVKGNCGLKNRTLMYEKAAELLYKPALTQENLDIAKARIKDYLKRIPSTAQVLYDDYDSKNNPYEFSYKEILANLDSIRLDDLKDCHSYILNNSRGIITANIPQEHIQEVRSEIIQKASELSSVKKNIVKPIEFFKETPESVVLTKEIKNSQADIMQVYRFKASNDIKDIIAGKLMNTILSTSLFNTLREKEHLAYSVYSSLGRSHDCGELSCNILTTTDNKEIGEFSYDNVQKSINGFKRQIELLRAGEFTEREFENAKLALKASLLENEGAASKLRNLESGMNSLYGISYRNKVYDSIDKVTKQDVLDFASKVFTQKPVYSVVATKDTLDFNKDYFKYLE